MTYRADDITTDFSCWLKKAMSNLYGKDALKVGVVDRQTWTYSRYTCVMWQVHLILFIYLCLSARLTRYNKEIT